MISKNLVQSREYKIVAVCGPDGAGKTSLLSQVHTNIQEKGIYFVSKKKHFCSNIVNSYMSEFDSESSMVIRDQINAIGCAFDFIQYYDEEIKGLLHDNNIIVCDRYSYCYLAYSTQVGCTYSYVSSLFSIIPEADLIVYIESDVETLENRLRQKNESNRNLERFIRGYEALFKNLDIPIYRIKNDCFFDSTAQLEKLIHMVANNYDFVE